MTAIVLAFGPTFAFGFYQAYTDRDNPRGVPTMLRTTNAIVDYLVTPAALVALAAGLYLTIDLWEFSDVFVGIGILAILVLLGISHGFFKPQGRRGIELAERDIEAAGTGEVTLSEEYQAISRRTAQVGTLAGLIVVVTIFFMTVKP